VEHFKRREFGEKIVSFLVWKQRVVSIGESLKHKTYIRRRKEEEAVYEKEAVKHSISFKHI
jgi:hypothetical protein